MRYDLTDLRLFLHAVYAGGFSQGARQANISISALSERMKALEQEIGKPLFFRRARGCELTPAGQEFKLLASAVMLQTERLEGTVSAWQNRLQGSVHLLANSSAISSFLPEILARFLARYPEVDLNFDEALSDDIAVAIRAGRADIGVVACTANLDGLHITPFRSDRLVLIAPAGHNLARRRRVAFSEIVDEPFVGLNVDAAIEKYLSAQAKAINGNMKSRIRLRSFDGVARVVAANAGIAIVPASFVATLLNRTGLAIIELSDAWAVRDLVICRRPGPTNKLEVTRLEEELSYRDSSS